jgi:hypothetical protein
VFKYELLLGGPEEFANGVDLAQEAVSDNRVVGLLGVSG